MKNGNCNWTTRHLVSIMYVMVIYITKEFFKWAEIKRLDCQRREYLFPKCHDIHNSNTKTIQ